MTRRKIRELEDGWAHVEGGRKDGGSITESFMSDALPPPSRDLQVKDLHDIFKRKQNSWMSTRCCQELSRTLERIKPDGGWKVTRAVVLGSGSFSRDNITQRQRSWWQFVAFMSIVSVLEQNGNRIEKFAQDPAYTSLDEQFLSDLGFVVLDISPQDLSGSFGPAEQYIGHRTLLFDAFMPAFATMCKNTK